MALPKNYYNFFEICKMEGIPANTAKGAVGYDGLKGISGIVPLQPISHLFREFPNGLRKQYGILRSHYDFWKRTGEPPKVSPGRPPKWKDNPNLVNVNIPISKTLYEEFKKVIDNANSISAVKYSYRDMIAVAMQEFIDRRPNLR